MMLARFADYFNVDDGEWLFSSRVAFLDDFSLRCCVQINVEKTFDFRINCVGRVLCPVVLVTQMLGRTYLAVVARSSSGSSHGSPLRRFLFPLGVEGRDGGHAAEEDLGGDGDVERPVVQLVMEAWH